MEKKSNEKKFKFTGIITIKDFSVLTGINQVEIIKFFFLSGLATNLNTGLKELECVNLCKHFGIKMTKGEADKDVFHKKYLDFSKETNVISRAPIVTIMGHVDHGKTTLLDKIRKTNVAQKEFANITQHIGAYQIKYKNLPITFLDTPGHEAFTKMRLMGGQIADIVIIVIAVDSGIQPQTIEAIQHALAANVKIIVFLNKVDKGEKNIPEIKQTLMKHSIVIEEFGGEVLIISGSAMQEKGIDSLLDAILFVAEMNSYVTTNNKPVIGTIIETKVEKGIGSTATVLLTRGKLNLADFIVMSSSICKVKNIIDDQNKSLKALLPSQPAKITGFKDLPTVGDKFMSFETEKEAKAFYETILRKKQEKIFGIDEQKSDNDINIIIKSDVSGTLEALKHLIEKLELRIIGSNVGLVNESDIQLATISKSIIINFNQKLPPSIEDLAKNSKIIIKTFKSIYQVEENLAFFKEQNKFIEKVMNVLGSAEVVKLWRHSKIGTIAGSIVKSGKISLKDKIKLYRGDNLLVTTTIKTFKTETFEIKDAKESQECGVVLNNWNDVKVGDRIEAFEMINKPE